MSEMSVIPVDSGLDLNNAGHRFRGEFLDKCGMVEGWLTMVLTKAAVRQKVCSDKAFLGDKLSIVRDIAKADLGRSDRILRRPRTVLKLLDRFHPFAGLRSVLAHSTQAACFGPENEILFLYQPVACTAPWSRIALGERAQNRILGALRALVKELEDQEPRAISPSSPPRP